MATIGVDGMQAFIARLAAEGRLVLGPTLRDGVVTIGEIETVEDLPVGVVDQQTPGSYRTGHTDSGALFGFAAPMTAWKRYLYPERTLLVRGHRSSEGLALDPAPIESKPAAFFGVRSCDLHAIGILDGVFLAPGAIDPTFAQRRADAFVVAVACETPSEVCFCASMGTGPDPTESATTLQANEGTHGGAAVFDVAVTELIGPTDNSYVLASGTERGAAMIAALAGRAPTDDEILERAAVTRRARAAMTREIRPQDPPLAAGRPNHPRWDAVAQRCLSCGNCTMVCPTCFCSTTEERTDLSGDDIERWRVWDSCFTADFSALHHTPVRGSTRSRYRQWLLHKLVTWHDQFGTSGCVGCGRCITWCPVAIDLTEEIAALAEPTGTGP